VRRQLGPKLDIRLKGVSLWLEIIADPAQLSPARQHWVQRARHLRCSAWRLRADTSCLPRQWRLRSTEGSRYGRTRSEALVGYVSSREKAVDNEELKIVKDQDRNDIHYLFIELQRSCRDIKW